jgi:hypothetical protein
MRSIDSILATLNLPARDADDRPTSSKRFADGGQYRVEIASCEGPAAMTAVIAASIGLAILGRQAPEAVASPLTVRV